MLFFTVTLMLSALSMALVAPANHAEKRQGEGEISFTTTCVGVGCTKPTTFPQPTTSKTTAKPTTTSTTTTTKKTTSSTTKYTPPPETTPTKTTKSTSSTKPTKTTKGETGPSSTRCPVPLYYQCGGYYDGKPWSGCKKCESGAKCIWHNDFYYQCVADDGEGA
ncbi:hypothetical protein CC80DRAFT_102950 [Byssothecium circinans]|uniref:CBM1 domain-containing protein n=1 Tax=Byssothecium circinans TaxID=147558 RepID=A0A6A5UE95_9PLEO|nr:hypothetical protein CC80DRAFT_102950 [Byssothecium circinans]